jgi:maltooligosyltrehalose trehalohydrolase
MNTKRARPRPIAPFGATVQPDGVLFRVWAVRASRVELVLENQQAFSMKPCENDYFEVFVPDLKAGMTYGYRLDGGPVFPDPISRFQPQGVHGPSQVVDPSAYSWGDDDWNGIPQRELVFYELHVGTFSEQGTFAGVQEKIPYLKELGVSAIQIMPLNDFPGNRNWGYDPAAMFAPPRVYGTPDDLRSLIDTAHQQGLAVFLDVIYNHLGPDGAYVSAFGPFYTDKHHTPWGMGMNYDDEHSVGVRDFFVENAMYWFEEFHFDGLRLDATFAIKDDSPVHFLSELAATVNSLPGRKRYLVAEDHRNLNRLLVPYDQGGYGLDGVWSDDFHHQMRNVVHGDVHHYYGDYAHTKANDLAQTIRGGWYYQGQFAPRMGRAHGTDPAGLRPEQFVFCIQNHDQIGNRLDGGRLHHEVTPAAYRMASAVVLFVQQLPLLFMGQEWATSAPFLFFSDHHTELGKLVTAGRKKELHREDHPTNEVPDPQDPATFERCRLSWLELAHPWRVKLRSLYHDLLHLRRELPYEMEVTEQGDYGFTLRRGPYHLLVALKDDQRLPLVQGTRLLLDTEQANYAENGQSPRIEGREVYFPVTAAALFVDENQAK